MKRRLVHMATAAIIGAATLSGCADSTSETASQAPTEDHGGVAESEPASSDSPSKADPDLDAYAAAAERALQSMLPANYKEIYSSVRVQPVYPDGIEYVYTYREPVDAAQAAVQIDSQLPLLKAAFRTQIVPEMRQHGWANPSARWSYLNPDGTVVWTNQVP